MSASDVGTTTTSVLPTAHIYSLRARTIFNNSSSRFFPASRNAFNGMAAFFSDGKFTEVVDEEENPDIVYSKKEG